MNSRFSVFPKPAPVLSHITHRLGSDSSHKPTVSDLSLPPARIRHRDRPGGGGRGGGGGKEEKEEEEKEEETTTFPGLPFFSLSLRARVRVARVRPSSLPSEPGLGCLIKKSSVSTVTKKKKKPNKQKNSKKQKQKERKRKKIQNKQTNKQGTAKLYFKPAGTSHPCLPSGEGGLWPVVEELQGGSSGGQRPRDALGATGQEAEETQRGERDRGPPRAARGWGARSGTGAK